MKIRSSVLLAMAGILASVSPATAGVVYSTGFEPTLYVYGNPLSGTDGWFQDFGPVGAITVVAPGRTGLQGAGISAAGNPSPTRVGHINTYDTATSPDQVITIKADIYLTSTGAPSDYFFMGHYASGPPIGYVGVLNTGALVVGSDTTPENVGLQVTRGAWHNYAIQFNFVTRTFIVFFDGIVVAINTPFATPFDSVFGAEFFQAMPNGTGTDQAFFDNVLVTTSPAPPTGTAALGLFCNPATGPTTPSAAYSSACSATLGVTPYTYGFIPPNSAPAGLTVNAATGAVSGSPTQSGPYSYRVFVQDSGNPIQVATVLFTGTLAGGPTVTSIAPSSATAGGSNFLMLVAGTGFCSQSTITWNGAPLVTSTGAFGTLATSVPASLIASQGTAQVGVTNPTATGCTAGTSNTRTFTINPNLLAPPTLTTLSPNSATAGGAAFTLTLTGANFCAQSTVQVNSTAVPTTYVSATSLTASIAAGLIANVAPLSVSVVNPSNSTCGAGTSNSLTFTINPPALPPPSLTSLAPSSAIAGGASFTMTLTGANFCSQSVVQFNGSGVPTTYVSATSLTASIAASLIAVAAPASIRVVNPTGASCGAGGSSNTQTLTITPAGGGTFTAGIGTLTFSRTASDTQVVKPLAITTPTPGVSFTVQTTTTSGGAWLFASPTSATTPATINVSATPAALSPGIYQGTVIISSTGYTSLQIPVTLNVARSGTQIPTFVVPPVVSVAYTPNSGTITQTIAIDSFDTAARSYQLRADVITPAGKTWLKVQQSSGTTPSVITASIDTNQLPKGTYVGRIQYTLASSPQNSPAAGISTNTDQPYRGGTCVVASSAPESLTIAPDQLEFLKDDQGGSFVNGKWVPVKSSLITVSTLGTAAQFRASFVPCDDLPNWLDLNPVQNQAATTTLLATPPSAIPPRPLRDGLADGVYWGALTVIDTATGGSGKVMTVEMHVGDGLSVGSNPGQLEGSGESTPSGTGTASNRVSISSPETARLGLAPQAEISPGAGARDLKVNIVNISSNKVPFTLVVNSDRGWLKLKDRVATGTTPAEVTLTIDPTGLQPGTYSGAVIANWQGPPAFLNVSFTVVPPSVGIPSVNEVSGAATLQSGPVAIGSLFTIKGQHLLDGVGSPTPCLANVSYCQFGSSPLSRNMSGVQVTINGTSVPLLFAGRVTIGAASYDQINAMVPWGITPGAANLAVKRLGIVSPDFPITVAAAAPGIFTTLSTGSGQGSVTLGSSITIASSGSPAARGSFIVLWCTGLGLVNNPAESGYSVPASKFVLAEQELVTRPRVFIGGVEAPYSWAGIAPDFVGLYQAVVQVPGSVTPGTAVPIQIRVGNATSPEGVTIAVSN